MEQVIAYKGSVDFGINLKEIEVNENTDENTLEIKLPKVTLKDYYVEPKSLTSIPDGKRDELQERLEWCRNDLKEKFENDTEMVQLAEESAKDTIKNFIEPIVKSVDVSIKLIITNQ